MDASDAASSGDFEAALDPVYKNIFDVPVSNNGARNRLIIYWKNIEDEFEFKNPSTVGVEIAVRVSRDASTRENAAAGHERWSSDTGV